MMKTFTLFKLCMMGFLLSVGTANAQLIEYALDDEGTFCYITAGGGSISTVDFPVRGGNIAHKHTASTNNKRAEIDDCSWHKYDAKGNVFWYGASYYLPESSFNDDIRTYIMQMRFSNLRESGAAEQNCTTRGCDVGGNNESGSGHHMRVVDGKWEFTLRYQDPECDLCKGTLQKSFILGDIATDQWTDFVFEANWSHETSGYLKIWKQVEQGGYELVADYQGRTWYDKYADGSNREGQDVNAPNYTAGLYFSTKTDTRIMYTDEIRVYQQEGEEDGFEIVRPDQNLSSKAHAPRPASGSIAQGTNVYLTWHNTAGTLSNDVYFGTSESLEMVQNQTATTYDPGALANNTTYYWKVNEVHEGGTIEGELWSFTTIREPSPCDGVVPINIAASEFDDVNTPDNVMDCDVTTRWSAEGIGQTLTFEIDHPYTIEGVMISWFSGNQRSSKFDIQVSTNGTTWLDVLTDQSSSGTSSALESFTFEPAAAAKYIRYVGRGNTVNLWNSITEFEIVSSGSSPVAVAGISLSESSISLDEGQTQLLNFILEPENASDKSVNWSSSDSEVASVNSKGLVSALSIGTATITLTTVDGDFSANCEIIVEERGTNSINLLTNGDMENGTTAWVGNVATIATTTDEQQNGTSSLSVTARGGNWAGPEQNILSILEDHGQGDYYGSAFIKIKTGEMNARVTIKLRIGGIWTYHILGQKVANSTSWTEVEGTKSLTWTGTLQQAWIYVEGSTSGDFWMDDVWLVKGTSKETGDAVAVTGVSLDITDQELEVGQTLELTATIAPEDASDKSVIWSSSDAIIASVNENGLVTGLSEGSVEITVETTNGGFTATSNITITPATGSVNVALNKTITASAYQDDDFAVSPPDNLVDGDLDSRWAAETFPQWAEIDLGARYDLSRFEMYTFMNRAYQYKIEVKNEGGEYTTAVDRSSNIEGSHIIDEATATGRYVKITVTGAVGYDGPWVSLNELKVYGVLNMITSLNNGSWDGNENSQTLIYPNPVSAEGLTIKIPEGKKPERMSIFTLQGQEIYTQKISGMNEIKVSRETFKSQGVYLIRFEEGIPLKVIVN